jgi:hypothetical protein
MVKHTFVSFTLYMVHCKSSIVFLCPVHIICGIFDCDPFTIEVDFLLLGVWMDSNINIDITVLYNFDVHLVIVSFHILINRILQCNIYQIKVTTVCEPAHNTQCWTPIT